MYRSGWSCRMMSCQKSAFRRTKPDTNCSPSPPASQNGASHGIRRRDPCMGSRATSATDGRRPETAGSAPERIHLRSTAPSGGAGRMRGRTWAWRLSRRWSQTSATNYGTTRRKTKRGCTDIYPCCTLTGTSLPMRVLRYVVSRNRIDVRTPDTDLPLHFV